MASQPLYGAPLGCAELTPRKQAGQNRAWRRDCGSIAAEPLSRRKRANNIPCYVFPQWETAYPFNMASWSLTFELAVNALSAAIAPVLTKRWLIMRLAISAALLLWLLLPVQGGAISLLCIVIVFPSTVALGAAADVGAGLASLCDLGGELSYPIYMTQGPILRIGEEVLKHLHTSMAGYWLIGAAEFLIVGVVSYCALKVFDKPLQSRLRRRVQATKSLQGI